MSKTRTKGPLTEEAARQFRYKVLELEREYDADRLTGHECPACRRRQRRREAARDRRLHALQAEIRELWFGLGHDWYIAWGEDPDDFDDPRDKELIKADAFLTNQMGDR
jgi:hypothetical protein